MHWRNVRIQPLSQSSEEESPVGNRSTAKSGIGTPLRQTSNGIGLAGGRSTFPGNGMDGRPEECPSRFPLPSSGSPQRQPRAIAPTKRPPLVYREKDGGRENRVWPAPWAGRIGRQQPELDRRSSSLPEEVALSPAKQFSKCRRPGLFQTLAKP